MKIDEKFLKMIHEISITDFEEKDNVIPIRNVPVLIEELLAVIEKQQDEIKELKEFKNENCEV